MNQLILTLFQKFSGRFGRRTARLSLRPGALLLIGVMTVTGCATLPPPNLVSPAVSLAEISLKDIGLSEVSFEAMIEAHNPNDVDVPMSNMRADLELFGVPFATGVAPFGTVMLPRRSAQLVPMEFRVSTLKVLDSIRLARTLDWSKLGYKVRGTANWADSTVAIPFGRDGSLEVIKRAMEVFAPLAR